MFFGQNNNNTPSIQNGAEPSGGHIFDVGTEDFEDKVINGSMEIPVLADFWAPWCGPCKQLGPALEKIVQSYGGKIKLAKINLDDNQQLAAALRVQSVPTVYAFFNGRPIDAFQGVLPESQLKAFIDKVLEAVRQSRPDALDIPEALKGAAQALAEDDLAAAQAIYMQILQADANNVQAFTGLIRVFIASGQIEQAGQWIENAPPEIANNPSFNEAKTALKLAQNSPSGDESELLGKLEANENDHQSRFDLALSQFAAGNRKHAMDNLLFIIEKDREWNEQAARQQLLKFFEALGQTDPLTIESRKKLSSLLFS
ncbi:MAG: thioredoxin family protein [Micavibrio sp.]|nr:thioredoxin family protein [Micavibrio sp.]|tara:strand:- start:2286 stop:3227 length:942 start_codon:yes stop_codon:yes gene_type:complete